MSSDDLRTTVRLAMEHIAWLTQELRDARDRLDTVTGQLLEGRAATQESILVSPPPAGLLDALAVEKKPDPLYLHGGKPPF